MDGWPMKKMLRKLRKLSTVKKGTPLYGQPSWWGEDEDTPPPDLNDSKEGEKRRRKKKGSSGSQRPSSLSLSSEGSPPTDTPPLPLATAAMESAGHPDPSAQPAVHQQASATYMEIPLHDDNLEGGRTPDGAEDHTREITPARSTVSSSISKDSLFSPDTKQTPKGNPKAVSPAGSEVNAATSFIVELEDSASRKVNLSASLSEFVPHKIRRGFRERKDKANTSRASSKESTPSKTSEERELSPSHQKKIDDLWCSVEGKGKPSRLSSVQATIGSSSLRSPNLEDIDRLSELSEERKSGDSDRKAPGKRPVSSHQSPQLPRSSKTRTPASATASRGGSNSSPQAKRKATTTTTTASSAVNVSQYADPTSYLIDKMFEGPTSSAPPSTTKTAPSPEHALYRESAGHDNAGKKSTDTTSSKSGAAVSKSSRSAILNREAKLKKSLHHMSPCKLVPDDEDDEDEDTSKNKTDDEDADDDLQITEDNGKEKEEDKASEAGTYTIEADEKEGGEEEETARKRIDEVFGVDVDSFVDRPCIDPLRLDSPGGYDNLYTDGDRTPLEGDPPPFSLPADDDDDEEGMNDSVFKTSGLEDCGASEEGGSMASDGGVQTWVSQLTALTAQHKMAAKDEDGSSVTKKPPQGLSRKRPGTGRKLPSIPTERSPVSSEHSSYIGDVSDNPAGNGTSSPATRADLVVNGKSASAFSQARQVRISSQSSSSGLRNGKSNGHAVEDAMSVSSPQLSTRSQGSVDTELLLQDTETVMAAMEARISHKSEHPDRRSPHSVADSDTDASSNVALANGDEDYVKPTLYKSPRDALSKRQDKTMRNGTSAPTSSTPGGKRSVGRTYSQTIASKARSVQSPRSVVSAGSTRRTVVSDVFSRVDSADNDSILSDVSSDAPGDFTRSGSKGKGGITMTKPNRAFQLRRARADSADEPTTPRSAKTSAPRGASARSSSVHNMARSRAPLDTGRSEATTASLGAQIVRKSRQNNIQEKAKSNNNLARNDGGRHSLRLQRASSLTIAQPLPAQHSVGSKRELGAKSPLRPTYSGSSSRGSLSITGTSQASSRCHSNPGSRSNSPKSAERAAWKRRKEYDPRRAVAEAKANKSREPTVTTRPKPSASSGYKRRMIRSASFGNPQELALSVQSSFSSSSLSGQNDSDGAFRRAFLPFHNSLRTDRSAHSADEDESIISNTSAQASYDTLIVSSVYQLSLKLKTTTDKTLNKLREQDRVSLTPSPIDDFLSDSGRSEITAWKSANQELAGVLRNLRKIERHVQMMNRVLFPEEDTDTEVSTGLRTGQEKQRYFQEIERIRNEIKGFQPIEPHDLEVASPEMAELGEQF